MAVTLIFFFASLPKTRLSAPVLSSPCSRNPVFVLEMSRPIFFASFLNALAGAPARILEDHVVHEAAGAVVDRLPGVLLAPANHQLAPGAIPRHLEDPGFHALRAPALVADFRPERVGVGDVLLFVEEPHLVPEDVAEDEEAPIADLELRRIAAELDRVRRAIGAEAAVSGLVLRRRRREGRAMLRRGEVIRAPFVARIDGVLAAHGLAVGEVGDRIESEEHQLFAAAGGDGRVRSAPTGDDEECEDRKQRLHRDILTR